MMCLVVLAVLFCGCDLCPGAVPRQAPLPPQAPPVLPEPARPKPAPAPAAKRGPCSALCCCGCQSGGGCDCRQLKVGPYSVPVAPKSPCPCPPGKCLCPDCDGNSCLAAKTKPAGKGPWTGDYACPCRRACKCSDCDGVGTNCPPASKTAPATRRGPCSSLCTCGCVLSGICDCDRSRPSHIYRDLGKGHVAIPIHYAPGYQPTYTPAAPTIQFGNYNVPVRQPLMNPGYSYAPPMRQMAPARGCSSGG